MSTHVRSSIYPLLEKCRSSSFGFYKVMPVQYWPLTLSLPMSPISDQPQRASVAYWRQGHEVRFSVVYYPNLQHTSRQQGRYS